MNCERSKEAVEAVTKKCYTVQGNTKQQQDRSPDNRNTTDFKEVHIQILEDPMLIRLVWNHKTHSKP
jgi:hypothetical protein